MNQLNNNSGHFIRINKIDINQNRICYTEYQNIVYKTVVPEPIVDLDGNSTQPDSYIEVVKEFKFSENIGYEFKLINLNNFYTGTSIDLDLCYNQLIIEKFPDYVLEEGLQNWLFARLMRITVLNSFILAHLKPINSQGDLDAIGVVIERVKKQHYEYYEDNHEDSITVIYLNGIDQADYLVIKDCLNVSIWTELKLS